MERESWLRLAVVDIALLVACLAFGWYRCGDVGISVATFAFIVAYVRRSPR